MYFHTDNPNAVVGIMESARRAYDEGRRLRIDVDKVGNLRVKVGEGAWSPPVASTMDPYRDTAHLNRLTVNAEDVQRGDLLEAFSNARVLLNNPDGEFHRRFTTAMPNVELRLWQEAKVTVLRQP